MKDYTKDPSVPLPIAGLLNDAQRVPAIDSIGYYAHMLGEAEATIKRLHEINAEAARAIRYLAENPRPPNGQARYNAEHLYQIADDLDRWNR